MRNLILILALAMPLSAQTPQIDALRAQIDSLEAVADSLGSLANVPAADSLIAARPDLVAVGVTASVWAQDSLYVTITLPYASGDAADKLTFREGVLAARDGGVAFVRRGWSFGVHRARVERFLDALDSVVD